MRAYIARRLLLLIPVAIGVVTLVFGFLRMAPGDPATIMLGEQARQVDVQALRKQLGLEGSLGRQYATFVASLARGNFGTSFSKRQPVAKLVFERLGATMELAVAAMIIAALVAFPLGVFAATRPGTVGDAGAGAFALLGVSMPNFWLGPLLIIVFSIKLGLTPVSGAGGVSHLILPAVTLGASMAGILARLTRSGLLEVLSSNYVRAARAKGAPERLVLWKHALRNALLPVVTVMGMQFGHLLAGAIITETIFAWPGVGMLLIDAINSRDYPLVQGCVLCISITYILITLITDLSYAWIDPRIRYEKR